jgi:CRISPR-associated protein Cmx8
MAKKKTTPGIDVVELDYNLAELPSSQHRAGLAGLVLMVQWLKRQGPHKGICGVTRLDERGATLRINQEGLAALFDEVYAASIEEKENDKPDPKKKLIREVKREVAKRGKTEEKTFYIYPVYVPKASFVADCDPSANGLHGIWVKLWRDMYFTIIRGRDRQRIPFKSRAEGKPTNDAEQIWEALNNAYRQHSKHAQHLFHWSSRFKC